LLTSKIFCKTFRSLVTMKGMILVSNQGRFDLVVLFIYYDSHHFFQNAATFYLNLSVTKSKNIYDLKGMPTNIVKKEVFYDRPPRTEK
jgi:hypothetical protein